MCENSVREPSRPMGLSGNQVQDGKSWSVCLSNFQAALSSCFLEQKRRMTAFSIKTSLTFSATLPDFVQLHEEGKRGIPTKFYKL